MTWFTEARTRDGVLAVNPAYKRRFDALYESLWEQPGIPAEILELCRLRLAQLHDSATEWRRREAGVDNGKRDGLRDWNRSDRFTEAERACLALAEVYAMDPRAITDEQAEAVKRHFGDVGLVALVQALGLFYGLTRLGLMWDLPPEEA